MGKCTLFIFLGDVAAHLNYEADVSLLDVLQIVLKNIILVRYGPRVSGRRFAKSSSVLSKYATVEWLQRIKLNTSRRSLNYILQFKRITEQRRFELCNA